MGTSDRHQKSWIFFTLLLALAGCSTVHDSNDPTQNLKTQILEMQKNQAKQAEQIEELNNKISQIKDQNKPAEKPVTPAPIVPAAKEAKVNPLAPVPAPIIQTIRKGIDSGDPAQKLYEQLVNEVKKPQLDSASKTLGLILKKYKDSPVASNALYLYGETLYERGAYSKGAEEFERLYKLYPDGNKAVAALYRLAQCYQKMGHPAEAQEAFQNIVTIYPGSREALDAEKQVIEGPDGAKPVEGEGR